MERSVPMLMHLQLCEGLNIVMTQDNAKIKAFQAEKLEEIYRYTKACESNVPNINLLRKRVEVIAKYFWTKDKGLVPFVFGKDYEPGKGEHTADKCDKLTLLLTQ